MNKLRVYNEYYEILDNFDELYQKSKNDQKFNKLIDLIKSEDNILSAYRILKKNKGSKTAGVNKHTIDIFENYTKDNLVKYV